MFRELCFNGLTVHVALVVIFNGLSTTTVVSRSIQNLRICAGRLFHSLLLASSLLTSLVLCPVDLMKRSGMFRLCTITPHPNLLFRISVAAFVHNDEMWLIVGFRGDPHQGQETEARGLRREHVRLRARARKGMCFNFDLSLQYRLQF